MNRIVSAIVDDDEHVAIAAAAARFSVSVSSYLRSALIIAARAIQCDGSDDDEFETHLDAMWSEVSRLKNRPPTAERVKIPTLGSGR
jgi:hypothetical protein